MQTSQKASAGRREGCEVELVTLGGRDEGVREERDGWGRCLGRRRAGGLLERGFGGGGERSMPPDHLSTAASRRKHRRMLAT